MSDEADKPKNGGIYKLPIKAIDPMHPGFFIRTEMRQRSWCQSTVAAILGCSRETVNRLCTGRVTVTIDMAYALAQAFDSTPRYWLELQMEHDLRSRGLSLEKWPTVDTEGIQRRVRELEERKAAERTEASQ